MNTAYLGDGQQRRSSPFKFMFAALALALTPASLTSAAFAQETPVPGATDAAVVDPLAAPPVDPLAATAEPEPTASASAHTTTEAFTVAGVWNQSDAIGKTVIIIMAIMLAGTIYVAVTKLIEQINLANQLKKAPAFWQANSLDEGLENLGRKNALRDIAEGAVAAANSSNAGLESRINRQERMSHQVGYELERVNARLAAGMAWLATVGSICPFVGLFGTVMGIVAALIKLSTSGDAGIDKVAGPVGEALIMTAAGLAVAVPAVILYNLLGRRNKVLADQARHFAIDVEKLMSTSTK
jgi:biopolymer transport protein ExbB